MIDISKQVAFINKCIDSSINNSDLNSRKLFGVADVILTIVDEKEKKIPAIRCGKEFEDVVYDDQYNLMAYHRQRTTQITLNAAVKSYGDSVNENLIKTSLNSMIVFMNMENVDATQEALANSILLSFPTFIPKVELDQGLDSVKFMIIGFDFDSIAIFRREYDGLQYDLKNCVSLIEVKYKIECSLNKSCINTCF